MISSRHTISRAFLSFVKEKKYPSTIV
jgi:hypothetical protein